MWLIVAAVIVAPPLLMAWSLCRVAADADRMDWTIDHDACPGCDGHLEFSDDGSNICIDCGSTVMRRSAP